METWMMVFVVAVAISVIIQTAMLVAMYVQFRAVSQEVERLKGEFDTKVTPILTNVRRMLEDSQERIASITADTAEIARLARTQAQRVDRILTDAGERLRGQIARGDHIVSGALEMIEDTGAQVKKTLWKPLNQVSAVMRGVMVGLDVLRGNRKPLADAMRQDEELFI
jgi:hypothetical protein